ncbi:aminomethyl transferase family protein [Desulfobacterales bacterium HSG16]|nr:aminomethyl transferase family protein [Desulfobacterales bacterium HSG16]
MTRGSGVKTEHMAVLTDAGLFDTSHMAMVKVVGPDSFDLLQRCFTKDLNACVGLKKNPLASGKCVYGAFLNEKGETIDDAIIYHVEESSYLIVVNAGMGSVIADHLIANKDSRNAEISDLTDKVGKLDVQGPNAGKIMKTLLADPDQAFDKLAYFSFKGHFEEDGPCSQAILLKDGTPILLSRTGYTGEFGFEIFIAPNDFVKLWKMIHEAGQDFGLVVCGLAARDSLRGGAVLPLSHQDIGHWPFLNHPWAFALPFGDDGSKFTKSFIGDAALHSVDNPEYTLAFVGNDLRKVSLEDQKGVFDLEGNEIGKILTCVTDMGIGKVDGKIYSIGSPDRPEDFKPKGLCCGFVKVAKELAVGQVVEIRDKRRKLKVTITEDVRPDRSARRPIRKMI